MTVSGVGVARGRAKPAAGGPVEGPWALPEGWRWERLGDVGTWSGGGTPSKARDDFWTDGTIPWVSPKDMKRPVIDSTEDRITPAAVAGSSTKLVEAGAVLCVMRSGILRHTFPVAVAAVDVTLNQDMRALTPKGSVAAPYLAHYLRSSGEAVLRTASKQGTTVNSIEAEQLDRHPVPVPPLDVQRRIVARIDDLFTDLDDGEALLARARDDLGTWRKALLKAAVTGELTADWRAANPPTETGADLLARILNGRRKKEWAAMDETSLPIEWAETTIGAVFDVFVGSTPSRGEKQLWTGEILWVSSGEVAFCRIRSTREGIAREALGDSDRRLHPPGTVMLGMIGEGKTRDQAAILDIWAAHNQNCASIRVSSTPVLSEFIYHFLRERYEVTRKSSSGGNQPALNKARIEGFVMPLPPLEEQAEIVTRLETAEAAWDGTALDADLSGPLRQSILSAAFRGDLVR